jgi:hypothetical protein
MILKNIQFMNLLFTTCIAMNRSLSLPQEGFGAILAEREREREREREMSRRI